MHKWCQCEYTRIPLFVAEVLSALRVKHLAEMEQSNANNAAYTYAHTQKHTGVYVYAPGASMHK